jgi:hypothetical protein
MWSGVLLGLLILALLMVLLTVQQLRRLLCPTDPASMDALSASSHRQVKHLTMRVQQLTRHMNEIRHAMDTMVSSLQAAEHQMHAMTLMAGAAIQTAQSEIEHHHAHMGYLEIGDDETEDSDDTESPDEDKMTARSAMPQIMIEIRRRGGPASSDGPEMISPDDLPPELQERLRVFQTIYQTLLTRRGLPSRRHPERN